jgi:hypothetical protein
MLFTRSSKIGRQMAVLPTAGCRQRYEISKKGLRIYFYYFQMNGIRFIAALQAGWRRRPTTAALAD